MCGWSILSLESYQGKFLKKKKNAVEWSPFLRAKALQVRICIKLTQL